MSHRFRASKYKNAAPKIAKHDPWIRDVVIGSYNSYGSLIKSSAAFTAFNVNATGSQLVVVPVDRSFRSETESPTVPILNAHSDLVTDLDFSPFEDGLLATCSADSTVKIWSLTPKNLKDLSTLSPECVTKSERQRRVENVAFNPAVEFLVTYTSQTAVTLWDILYNKELFHDSQMHEDTIMSFSWRSNGNLLSTCAKDRKVRIIDVRANDVVASAQSYDNNRESRVLWLGDSPYILTTGFDSMRTRQIQIRDTRNFSAPVKTQSFDSSTGVLIPLYDPDTKMLFVSGRGDTAIYYFEFTESEPYLSEGYRYHGEQTKGVCLAPKRALKVMDTEVNRVLQLTSNSVVSIPYHVPRKTYTDFHAELYPDTRGTNTCGVASMYMEGSDGVVLSISLNPKSHAPSGDENPLVVFKPNISDRRLERHNKASSFSEHDTKFKKTIPEPRPRKKSASNSSSEEVLDSIPDSSSPPASAPVPKTRAKNNGSSIPFLRTPSSFMTRPSSNFTRSTSVNETESMSLTESNSLPVDISIGSNGVNGTKHHVEEDYTPVEVKKENGHTSLPKSDSVTDGACFSRSSKTYELARNPSADEQQVSYRPTQTSDDDEQNRTSRMSVADRLKMFQQGGQLSQLGNPTKTSAGDETVHTSVEPAKISHHVIVTENPEKNRLAESANERPNIPDFLKKEKEETSPNAGASRALKTKNEPEKSSSTAPIAKPERKITPPSQVSSQKPKEYVPPSKPPAKRIDTVFGQVSKYRNFKAAPVHKKFHIENLRNVSTTCPGESELIQANAERVAVPLNTPGGKIAIYELNRPGRQPDGVISALVHGTKVMDFMFDPFDSHRLVVGCDDGRMCIWKIPQGGLKEQTNQPEATIPAHAEKVYFVRFHPLAKDILASGSYDLTVRIWDLSKLEEVILIQLHPDQVQIFSFCWSPCGSKFVTACKDGKLRVYEPRIATNAITEGKGPAGVRGGRACWALDGKYVIVAGFDRSSERQILMYNAHDLTNVATVFLDVSPSILVPFYDEDSSILLLTGRGDSTIFAFDVIDGDPYLRQLSNHRCPGAHQGVAFLKKNACEVQNVEFARGLRLTELAVEPWAFIVPRVKSEFFQDDLFPPTKVLWEPCMSASQWLSGANVEPRRISLKPVNMKSVGEITSGSSTRIEAGDIHKAPSAGNGVAGNYSRSQNVAPSSILDKEARKKQQETLEQAMKEKLPMNMKLEQDLMEGVDEVEWNE